MHTSTEDKSDNTKDSFCEEPGCVFSQFPKYYMKIFLEEISVQK
jgi:hypothetical protein